MTVKIIRDPAATAPDIPSPIEPISMSTSPASASERPGLLMAGFVLLAALTTATSVGTLPIASYYDRRRHEIVAEAATLPVECDQELIQEIRDLFERGASEFFEDGMRSAFSRTLIATLKQHGKMAIKAVAEYLFSGVANPDVVSEALRWLADFNDPDTLTQRWIILQRLMQDPSPRVRDGAVLGFATLDHPRARPLLLEAREKENIPELRSLMDKVIEQLNTTNATIASNS